MDFFADFLGNAFQWVILIIMVVSMFGLMVPIFPGNVVIWVTALVYGLMAGFETRGIWLFAIITLLMIGGVMADNLLMGARAKKAGGSCFGITIAFFVSVIVSFFFTPIAGLIAAPITIFLFEFMRIGDTEKALHVTTEMVKGCGWAFVVRFGLAALEIGVWAFWAFGG